MTRNLILGLATNQRPSDVAVFLRSARTHHPVPGTDIVLITNTGRDLADIARETSAELYPTVSRYGAGIDRRGRIPRRLLIETLRFMSRWRDRHLAEGFRGGYHALLEAWQHPVIIRWNLYRRFLDFRPRYDAIALCDVRDVAFQAPIFEDLPPDAVLIGEDSEPMTGTDCNSVWLIEAYGKDAFEPLRNRTPLCIGVLIGRGDPVERFVSQFEQVFLRSPFGKIEQALANRMYFDGAFEVPVEALPNSGRSGTLGVDFVRDMVQVDGTLVRNRKDGTAFPVVHMYDRFPETRDAIERAFLTG